MITFTLHYDDRQKDTGWGCFVQATCLECGITSRFTNLNEMVKFIEHPCSHTVIAKGQR